MRMELTENNIYNMDGLEGIRQLEDTSIDLICIDPPYYNVINEDWDKQWDSLNDYLLWLNEYIAEFYRLLKPKGSLYCFCDERISAYIQIQLDRLFEYENCIIITKSNPVTFKSWKMSKRYAKSQERLLFYTLSQRNTNVSNPMISANIYTSPVVKYLREQKQLAKDYYKWRESEFCDKMNEATNTKSMVSRHCFQFSQFVLPNLKYYTDIQNLCKGFFLKPHEELRNEYIQSPMTIFHTFKQKRNYSDIWEFSLIQNLEKVYHPTQKAQKILQRIIETSSNEGDLVLDCFMGSGSCCVTAKELRRKYIGFELDKSYFEIAKQRLGEVQQNKITDFFK